MIPRDRIRWLFTGTIVTISLLFIVVVLFDIVPLVRGPEAWRWWLVPLPSTGKLILTSGVILAFILGWLWLGNRLTAEPSRKRIWLSLLILALLVIIVQFALMSLSRSNPLSIVFERLVSDQASGYFTVATEIDHLQALLKEYPERMPQFRPDPHPRSKPPGIVLMYWGATAVLDRTPGISEPIGHWARNVRCADLWLVSQSDAALAGVMTVGLLTIFSSVLVIWPAYGLAARRWGIQAGWLAAGLMAVLPGRLLFVPHLDTVYPFLALLALFLVDSAVRKGRWWLTAAAGIVLSLATFFSLVNGLAAGLVGLYLLLVYLPDRRWRMVFRHGLALAAGLLSIWLLYWLYARVTPFDIYIAARPARHDLTRSYWFWLVGNIYDFAVFVGLPVFLSTVFITVTQLKKRTMLPLALAFWAVFLLVDISGFIRAEVGRIWLMLAPFPAVLAAQTKNRANKGPLIGKLRAKSHLLLLTLTALSMWAMSLRWEVTRLEWSAPVERVIETSLPDLPLINVSFGDEIQLAAYEVEVDDRLSVMLYWQTLERPDIPYTVFVHVVDEGGNIVLQQDTMPQNGRLPTTCWQPDEIIVDIHELEIMSLGPGSYQIVAGLYDQSSETRLGELKLTPALIVDD